VKLFLRFAGQQDGTSWAMATGWLIEPDLLVTAGHCANDWSHNYGKLTHVKAYIGYTGKEAVSEANQVQMRMGTKVATTESWLTKGNIDSRGDVSFISLNKPFTHTYVWNQRTHRCGRVSWRLDEARYWRERSSRSQ
jgi:V8-like Glu-specific endopeptidase